MRMSSSFSRPRIRYVNFAKNRRLLPGMAELVADPLSLCRKCEETHRNHHSPAACQKISVTYRLLFLACYPKFWHHELIETEMIVPYALETCDASSRGHLMSHGLPDVVGNAVGCRGDGQSSSLNAFNRLGTTCICITPN